jgi:hypothetical protein
MPTLLTKRTGLQAKRENSLEVPCHDLQEMRANSPAVPRHGLQATRANSPAVPRLNYNKHESKLLIGLSSNDLVLTAPS